MNFVLKIESMIVKTILCLTELLGSIDLIGTSARNTLKTYHGLTIRYRKVHMIRPK